MKLDKTIYLEMPIALATKREWNSKGFKVLDSRFKPQDATETETAGAPTSPEDIDAMKKGELAEWLTAHGVEEVPGSVGERRDLLKRIMFVSDAELENGA